MLTSRVSTTFSASPTAHNFHRGNYKDNHPPLTMTGIATTMNVSEQSRYGLRRCSGRSNASSAALDTGTPHPSPHSPHLQKRRRLISELRAERRKERSRLAAQIWRNRESQNVMLLQNALPISDNGLGLIGIPPNFIPPPSAEIEPTDSLDLFSIFEKEEEDKDDEHEEADEDERNGRVREGSSRNNRPSMSTALVNLERSDVLRIAGHTLFMLNSLRECMSMVA